MFGVFLSPEHLVVAVPVAVLSAVGGFLVSQYLNRRCCKKGMVNTCISKDSPKVVHSFDMEDIGSKAVYCRCWKSKKVRPPSLSLFCRVFGQLEHLYWEIKISFITRVTHTDFRNSNIQTVSLSTKGKFDKTNCVFFFPPLTLCNCGCSSLTAMGPTPNTTTRLGTMSDLSSSKRRTPKPNTFTVPAPAFSRRLLLSVMFDCRHYFQTVNNHTEQGLKNNNKKLVK